MSLVEIIIVISVVAALSSIMISDFPKIQRNFALTRAAYKLAQDLKIVQDFGMSGIRVKDSQGNEITLKGYGVYVNLNGSQATAYSLYADVIDSDGNNDQKYVGDGATLCSDLADPRVDCIVDKVDITLNNQNLRIKGILNVSAAYTSINFSPPAPAVKIDNLNFGQYEAGIILGLANDDSQTKTVIVNTAGLIKVE